VKAYVHADGKEPTSVKSTTTSLHFAPVLAKHHKWVYKKWRYLQKTCFWYKSRYICLKIILNISKIMNEFTFSSNK